MHESAPSSSTRNLLSTSLSGKLCSCPSVFVDAQNVLLVAIGKEVLVLSSKTGGLLLSFQSHTKSIVGLVRSPQMDDEVISASSDGVVFTWKVPSGAITNKCTVEEGAIIEMRTITSMPPKLLLVVPDANKARTIKKQLKKLSKKEKSGRDHGKKVSISAAEAAAKSNLAAKDTASTKLIVVGLVKGQNLARLASYKNSAIQLSYKGDVQAAVDNGQRQFTAIDAGFITQGTGVGEEFIFCASKRSLFAWCAARYSAGFLRHEGTCQHSITCIATCGPKNIIATGHENGQIMLWHGVEQWLLSSGSDAPRCQVLHWHAHAVSALCFSATGEELYSGGEEGVLVTWEWRTGKKDFIPRLGAPILSLAVPSEMAHVAVGTSDNCIRVFNVASFKEEWTLRGPVISQDPRFLGSTTESADPQFHCFVNVDPLTRQLITNGYPGQLQGLSVPTKTLESRHEVAHFTRVSRTETYTRIRVPSVVLAAHSPAVRISEDAVSLSRFRSTVDVKHGEEMPQQYSLKFWASHSSSVSVGNQGGWKLRAQVDAPHPGARVTCMAWNPLPRTGARAPGPLVTGASDGSMRVWHCPATDNDRAWTCAYAVTYRSCAVGALAFSGDGSILAMAHRNVVSLWDFAATSLRGTIVLPTNSSIRHVSFIEPQREAHKGGGSGRAYLAMGSTTAVGLYDILAAKFVWTAEGEYTAHTAACADAWTVDGCWLASGVIERGTTHSDKKYRVELFGLDSAVPLSVYDTSSKATSVAFWSGVSEESGDMLTSGVAAITSDNDLHMIGSEVSLGPLLRAPAFAAGATTRTPTLPVLDMPEAANGAGAQVLVGSGVGTGGVLGLVAELFPARNTHLPPLSAVFDTFMWRALATDVASNASTATAATAPRIDWPPRTGRTTDDATAPSVLGGGGGSGGGEEEDGVERAIKRARQSLQTRGLTVAGAATGVIHSSGSVGAFAEAYDFASHGKANIFEKCLSELFGSEAFYSRQTHQSKVDKNAKATPKKKKQQQQQQKSSPKTKEEEEKEVEEEEEEEEASSSRKRKQAPTSGKKQDKTTSASSSSGKKGAKGKTSGLPTITEGALLSIGSGDDDDDGDGGDDKDDIASSRGTRRSTRSRSNSLTEAQQQKKKKDKEEVTPTRRSGRSRSESLVEPKPSSSTKKTSASNSSSKSSTKKVDAPGSGRRRSARARSPSESEANDTGSPTPMRRSSRVRSRSNSRA